MFESMQDSTDKPSIASHTGIITKPGRGLEAQITEALTRVKEHPLSVEYTKSSIEFCVFRPINLTPDQSLKIAAKARTYIGDGYGYGKLLAQMGDGILGGPYVFRRLCRIDSLPICSCVVGSAFASVGLDFGISFHAVTPDEIWDFCIAHPECYRFIWQQGEMYKE